MNFLPDGSPCVACGRSQMRISSPKPEGCGFCPDMAIGEIPGGGSVAEFGRVLPRGESVRPASREFALDGRCGAPERVLWGT